MNLKAMINTNLISERVAVESYTQQIVLTEDILAVEQEHAEELKDWLMD